jgi:hypothetical protein
MRQLLVVVGLLALMLPLLRDPLVAAQEQAQVQRDATGNPIGVLGPVNALGQEIKRPPPPTGPAPHLPDGTIDLGTAPGSSCRAGATAPHMYILSEWMGRSARSFWTAASIPPQLHTIERWTRVDAGH